MKEIEGESQVAASQQSVSQSEEKNRNEGSGLTNYIVNKINRENKNVRTMKVGAYYALLFLHGGRNTCCLFYSVEFDSLQQITASRSKKENHVSASRNFPSLFFLLSLSFLFLFFFFFISFFGSIIRTISCIRTIGPIVR